MASLWRGVDPPVSTARVSPNIALIVLGMELRIQFSSCLNFSQHYFEHRRKLAEQFEGMLMAVNNDKRQWTSEKPTKSGFYYYRQSNDEEPIVLKVEVLDDRKGLKSVVWLPGDNAAEPLEQCHGDWAGPIEPPA
jgi:hypothetical protein